MTDVRKVVALLLEKGASIKTEGGHYGNALQAAASQGHDDVVELLLQWGADVNARGGYFGTALQAAASGAGHLGIEGDSIQYKHAIEMQLEQGANVEEVVDSLLDPLAKKNFQGLHCAIQARMMNRVDSVDGKSANYKKVFALLDHKGVDVNAHGGYLYYDDRPSKYEKTIHMLLDKGAEINALGGHFGTALQAAVCEEYKSRSKMPAGGNLKIARLLLNRGANVNATGGVFGTALQAAAAEGNPDMVQMLLQAGAEVNYQGGYWKNALQAAIRGIGGTKHCEEIVAILLDRGAVVECSDWSCNAITTAASRGLDKVVTMLLHSCTEIHGEILGGAITMAAECGHEGLVQLLLKRRIGVVLPNGYLENALQAASGHGRPHDGRCESSYINILNKLISEGAKINQPGGCYGNALQAAIAYQNYTLVDFLLEYGADINANGGFFGNALQALASTTADVFHVGDEKLCSKGQQLIATLLDRGADVNAEGGKYGTALQAAVVGGLEEIVVLLLERGANINLQGGAFGTALHAAVFKNFLHMIQLLLRYKVDVETPDQYGFTVLFWVQNDRDLTSERRGEVRTLINKLVKGSAANLVDVATRRKNIVSWLEQLKKPRDGEDSRFYHLGKALLYDGRCEAAAYCLKQQCSKFDDDCLNCDELRGDDKFYICKVCRDFVVCSKCIKAPSDRICKTHGFLEITRVNGGETETSLEEDRSLGNWIDQMLIEYRI